MATVHVIGAGMAGLSCAVELVKARQRVVLWEAAAQAGGRCRSFHDATLDRTIDNGNHLILGANPAVFAYLETIGARDGLVGQARAAFPFVDLRTGERWTVRPNAGPLPWWIMAPRAACRAAARATTWPGSRSPAPARATPPPSGLAARDRCWRSCGSRLPWPSSTHRSTRRPRACSGPWCASLFGRGGGGLPRLPHPRGARPRSGSEPGVRYVERGGRPAPLYNRRLRAIAHDGAHRDGARHRRRRRGVRAGGRRRARGDTASLHPASARNLRAPGDAADRQRSLPP